MIHQYKLNGYNIVLDTVSGAVHAVDDLAYDVIERFEFQDLKEIQGELLDREKNADWRMVLLRLPMPISMARSMALIV